MLISGLDVGTTGCKLTVYNEKGNFVYNSYREYDVSRVNGEHEIDAENIFSAVCEVIRDVVSKYEDLRAIGVTTLGESFVLLDKEDRALINSMLYTDPRGEAEAKHLTDLLGEETIIGIAGVKPHHMYSLPKLMWVKNNLPEVYKKVCRILLMQDYIVYMLTGCAQIDYSLASRTMAFDIQKKCWSEEIFASAGIDKGLMSRPVPTGTTAGQLCEKVRKKLGIHTDITIISGAHDQAAAAIGAGVFEVGQAVDGTGTVECITPVSDHVPKNIGFYREGYSAAPYVFEDTYVCYALSFTGGAALKWYRDNFAKYEKAIAEKNGGSVYSMLDSMTKDEPTGILIMPHFTGAANPYMDSGSRAAIAGISLEHTNYDIYKALMEGVTYEILINIEHLESFGIKPKQFFATGGGASSEKWLGIKADILNRPITALDAPEAGACGTCMLAAVAVGICKDLYEAKELFVRPKKTFFPDGQNSGIYKKYFQSYKKLYPMMKKVFGDDSNE